MHMGTHIGEIPYTSMASMQTLHMRAQRTIKWEYT